MTKWIVVIYMLTANKTVAYLPKEPMEYPVETQCKEKVLELINDPGFIRQMFSEVGVLAPSCLEVQDSKSN